MLVLSRKIGEELIIGGNIIVRVVAVKGARVSLAIDAPIDIPVFRSEIAPSKSGMQAQPQLDVQDGVLDIRDVLAAG